MRTLAALFFFSVTAMHAQTVINPWWGSIFAEGTFSPGEWDLAPTVPVETELGNTCLVAVAVDDWGLYVGFMGHLESDVVFPEILLDVNHDRTADWNNDDHWFHVSATNCHYVGAYGVYDDCSPLPSDWSAHPNFSPGAPLTDSVEVAIPWWFLGIDPEPGDTIGMALVLTNTALDWHLWPLGAIREEPITWGHLVIPAATGIDERDDPSFMQIWPNPSSNSSFLSWDGPSRAEVRLYDAQGRAVWLGMIGPGGQFVLPMHDLPAAPYMVLLRSDQGVFRRTVIKQ